MNAEKQWGKIKGVAVTNTAAAELYRVYRIEIVDVIKRPIVPY